MSDLGGGAAQEMLVTSIEKNGRAKAVRFSTLDALCAVLDCQPGDLIRWVPDDEGGAAWSSDSI